MVNYSYRLLFAAVFFLLSSLSYAGISDRSASKLLDLSGLTKQVEQFPAVMKAGLQQAHQQGGSIPDAEFAVMVNSIDESFDPGQMIKSIKLPLKKELSKKEAKKLIAWYESDLGKKITQAEEQASTPKGYQEMMASAQSLLANKERVAQAKKIDELVGATDMTMEVQKNTSVAIYSAMLTAANPGKPLDLEPIKAQIDSQMAQARASVEQMVIVSFVYSYRNIAIKDLKKYEEFLARPTTKKFNNTVIEAMMKSLESSIVNWAKKLGEMLSKKK